MVSAGKAFLIFSLLVLLQVPLPRARRMCFPGPPSERRFGRGAGPISARHGCPPSRPLGHERPA